MPRYFFHQRGPETGQYITDPIGYVFPDQHSAKAGAAATIRRLPQTNPTASGPWIFEVVDEAGELALILPFVERDPTPTISRAVRRPSPFALAFMRLYPTG